MSQGTIDVRQGEALDVEKLEPYLRHHLDMPSSPLVIRQFSAGHSNLTYLLSTGEWEAVLRRPPLGPVAPKAHDMAREFRVLRSLNSVFEYVPEPLLLCEMSGVIGSPFFVMERKKGVVLNGDLPPGTTRTKELCHSLSEQFVRTLVELHNIEYEKIGLGDFGYPHGFLERQVKNMFNRLERAKTDDIPATDELKSWMSTHLPHSQQPCIIHYDYKLDNVMFDDKLERIVGIFDWELSTIGDPIADLGSTLSYWVQADDPEILLRGFGKRPLTTRDGFLTRDELVHLYATLSGRDVSSISFCLALAYLKLAVICQQIYYRYRNGQTSDERFKTLGSFANDLIELALLTTTR
jgi:aminoglycoside phosphotransferase (APT) family kinase protein